MKAAAALISFLALTQGIAGSAAGQHDRLDPSVVSRHSYLTIHNVKPAHEITLGAGTKVGLLDHSFALSAHPELYAGSVDFRVEARSSSDEETHHGYWMALTLREIAPQAAVYALDIPTQEGTTRTQAVVQALNWAVLHDLDVVTYCGGTIPDTEDGALGRAVERAVAAGVVVVFVDYPHASNLLPGEFETRIRNGARTPDLNIFSYDCTALLADRFVALVNPDDDGMQRHRPFLAHRSTGPVVAGLVALMRSVDPDASPTEIKRILMDTSRSLEYRGHRGARVPDAFEAVTTVAGVSTYVFSAPSSSRLLAPTPQ